MRNGLLFSWSRLITISVPKRQSEASEPDCIQFVFGIKLSCLMISLTYNLYRTAQSRRSGLLEVSFGLSGRWVEKKRSTVLLLKEKGEKCLVRIVINCYKFLPLKEVCRWRAGEQLSRICYTPLFCLLLNTAIGPQ